jgi:hypothetical protein
MSVFKRAAFLEKGSRGYFYYRYRINLLLTKKAFFIRFLLKILPLPLKLEVLLVLKPEAKQSKTKQSKAEKVALLLHLKQKSNPFVTKR